MSQRYYDNSLVLHRVYGQDTKLSKSALKGLLQAFLGVKIERMEVKNPNYDGDKNVPLIVVLTLEDQTKDLIEILVNSPKESEEGMDYYERKRLYQKENIERYCLLRFFDKDISEDENMLKLIRFVNGDTNRVIKEFDNYYWMIVEPKELKGKTFEQMKTEERYMYYLRNRKAENDDVLDKIIETDENVQALDARLKEICVWVNRMDY